MRRSRFSPSGFVLAEFGLRGLVFAPFLALTLLEHEQHELYTKPLSDVRIREKRGPSKSAFLAAPKRQGES